MIRSSDNTDPTVLNGNVGLDMSSVNSVSTGCVLCIISHLFLCLVLLIYGTFLALRMSESALLGDMISLLLIPLGTSPIAPCFSSFLFHFTTLRKPGTILCFLD